MADYANSKDGDGIDPANTVDAAWSRYEPLLTAKALRRHFLFGIPLSSVLTKETMTDDDLDGFIADAVTEVEQELLINIFPTQHKERYAFDRHEYQSMGYLKLTQRPVASVERFAVETSNDQEIWLMSPDWIDAGYLQRGLIYIVPINIAYAPSAVSGTAAAGSAVFLAILGQQPWVPAYWSITYTSGFKDGKIPKAVNTYIGCTAAINVLNLLAATNAKSGSKSLGIDGLSQSSSNPGPELYKTAVEMMEKRKKLLNGRLRNYYGTKLFSGNV